MLQIRCENLHFRYIGKFAHSNFELNVGEFAPCGRCTAIMGNNGSGKTTLGKLVAGVLAPTSGFVYYDNVNIATLKLGEIGKQVGYLFQEPSRQIFAAKPLDEIALPLTLRGVDEGEAKEIAAKMLAKFDLSHIESSTTFNLSRGEKQRLAIAATMVMNPQFFVLDEPTTGLDKPRRHILADTLKAMMEEGMGIILISHDAQFVKDMGASVRHMEGGVMLDG